MHSSLRRNLDARIWLVVVALAFLVGSVSHWKPPAALALADPRQTPDQEHGKAAAKRIRAAINSIMVDRDIRDAARLRDRCPGGNTAGPDGKAGASCASQYDRALQALHCVQEHVQLADEPEPDRDCMTTPPPNGYPPDDEMKGNQYRMQVTGDSGLPKLSRDTYARLLEHGARAALEAVRSVELLSARRNLDRCPPLRCWRVKRADEDLVDFIKSIKNIDNDSSR